ncbi:MAG: 3-hydroxyacyl-ACP dehydratase FabZ [Pseudomonadota bacterium]
MFLRFGHPFPTVVIDRVEELEREKRIKAVKWVTADELYLSGHFPGEPIMPGVLTLEGLIQSALIFLEESFTRGNIRISLEKVERLRFKRAVLPGDRLDFLVSLTGKEGNLWKFKGKAQVGAEVAAEADVILKVDVREVGFEL